MKTRKQDFYTTGEMMDILKNTKYICFQAQNGKYKGMTVNLNEQDELVWNNQQKVNVDYDLITTKWQVIFPVAVELKILPIDQLYMYAVA